MRVWATVAHRLAIGWLVLVYAALVWISPPWRAVQACIAWHPGFLILFALPASVLALISLATRYTRLRFLTFMGLMAVGPLVYLSCALVAGQWPIKSL